MKSNDSYLLYERPIQSALNKLNHHDIYTCELIWGEGERKRKSESKREGVTLSQVTLDVHNTNLDLGVSNAVVLMVSLVMLIVFLLLFCLHIHHGQLELWGLLLGKLEVGEGERKGSKRVRKDRYCAPMFIFIKKK